MMSSMELMEFVELTRGERAVQILPKPFSSQHLKAFLYDVLEQVELESPMSAYQI